MEQVTPEWFLARAGLFSASRIKDLLGTEAARQRYLLTLLSQRLRVEGSLDPTPQNAAMRWGVEHEAQARDQYWAATGNTVVEHPGQKHPEFPLWSSPDGLVLDDGMIEIKCPNSDTHLRTILSATTPPEHFPQIQTGMLVYRRAWCDFVSFDPRNPVCPIFISRVERDDEMIDGIISAVEHGERALQEMVDKVLEAAS